MIRRILAAAMLSATLMAPLTFAQDQSGTMQSENKMDDAMKSGDKMMKNHKSKHKSKKHKAPKKSMMKDDKMKSEKSM